MENSSPLPYVFIRFVRNKDINSRFLFLMPLFYGTFSAVRLTPRRARKFLYLDPTSHLTRTVTGRPKEPLWNKLLVTALVVCSFADWSAQK